MARHQPGPLAGVRVIELAQVMAGPVCGLMLADLGADVLKIEKLPGGDDSRRFSEPSVNGESAAFLMLNRNKRSVALDLKQAAARDALRRLVARADVVIENFRTGAMERLGLGYEALSASNPALIYCAISGYGRTGPYAARGGFDLVAQAGSGLMSITGEPGRPPVKVGSPVCDINAGILGALGVVSAYVHRLRTGEGQLVDTSLFEAGVQLTYWQAAMFFATGIAPGPLGSAHPLAAPYQAFPTADGWIAVGGANQSNWERLLRILDAPALGADDRFHTNAGRVRHREALAAALTPYFARRTSAEWLADLDAAGIPAGPINDLAAALADPQALARGMVIETDHPRAGRTRALGLPIAFSATGSEPSVPAPLLGEHTRAALAEAGYPEDEINELVRCGAAGVPAARA